MDKITRLPIRKRDTSERTLKVVQPWEPDKCSHEMPGNTFHVDERAGTVECGRCGQLISPIWVLAQLGHQESYWLRAYQDHVEIIRKLDEKRRTKCRHCGKMTEVRVK